MRLLPLLMSCLYLLSMLQLHHFLLYLLFCQSLSCFYIFLALAILYVQLSCLCNYYIGIFLFFYLYFCEYLYDEARICSSVKALITVFFSSIIVLSLTNALLSTVVPAGNFTLLPIVATFSISTPSPSTLP